MDNRKGWSRRHTKRGADDLAAALTVARISWRTRIPAASLSRHRM